MDTPTESENKQLLRIRDHQGTRYVPATVSQSAPLTTTEQNLLSQATQAVSHLITHRQPDHLSKSDDTALTHALGSLVYSIPYLLVAAVITGGILFLSLLIFGGDERFYLLLWLILWGACALHYLTKNREVGLSHSAAGIALEEIESRERLAMYVIDKHLELIEKRWKPQN
jgi:hypothetical protein